MLLQTMIPLMLFQSMIPFIMINVVDHDLEEFEKHYRRLKTKERYASAVTTTNAGGRASQDQFSTSRSRDGNLSVVVIVKSCVNKQAGSRLAIKSDLNNQSEAWLAS